jgi:hypothetical protein
VVDKPALKIMDGSFSVCRLKADDEVPEWSHRDGFYSISRTDEELSIVCEQKNVPESVKSEGDFSIIKVLGPLDFSLTGILARISSVLASKKISIFAISTFDTDYILVRVVSLGRAVDALRLDGYKIV